MSPAPAPCHLVSGSLSLEGGGGGGGEAGSGSRRCFPSLSPFIDSVRVSGPPLGSESRSEWMDARARGPPVREDVTPAGSLLQCGDKHPGLGGGGERTPMTTLKRPGACPFPPLQARGSFALCNASTKTGEWSCAQPPHGGGRGGKPGWGMGQGLSATQTLATRGGGGGGAATWRRAVLRPRVSPPSVHRQQLKPAPSEPPGVPAPGWGCSVRVRVGGRADPQLRGLLESLGLRRPLPTLWRERPDG